MSFVSGKLAIELAESSTGLSAAISPPRMLPIEAMLVGKSPDQGAQLLGLIYNMCQMAQITAVQTAFSRPITAVSSQTLRRECLRDHVRCISDVWPRILGLAPDREVQSLVGQAELPINKVQTRLFGEGFIVPETWQQFENWVERGHGVAAKVLTKIMADWPEAWGQADLPILNPADPIDWPNALQRGQPVENGPVCRVSDHPVMQEIRKKLGPGIVWRMMARMVDAALLLAQAPTHMAPLIVSQPHVGAAHAARGVMLVRGQEWQGQITKLERLSPTDFSLVPNGLLSRALKSITASKSETFFLETAARLIVAVIDPCYPTDLTLGPKGARHA